MRTLRTTIIPSYFLCLAQQAEKRVSYALGIPLTARDTSPSIALPKHPRNLTPDEVTDYIADYGHPPIYHQGPDGIKTAIDAEFRAMTLNPTASDFSLGIPAKNELLERMHKLYTQDARFKDLQGWPATRDWLRNQLGGQGLIIPD
jgi:hypothetical protein